MRVGLAQINGPITDHTEAQAVAAVMESGMLTSPRRDGGPAVQRLERAVREFTGARHAVAVSSGTAALHAVMISMDIGHGDEVIIPSFSYVATANAVVAAGATPIFADTTGNHTMDADAVSAAITPRTRCIIPVHLYGRAARMDEILDVSSGRGIHVIEDAAQSLGTTMHGRHTGTIADAGCYSMYPGKVVTAGEGGVVVTDNDSTYERLLSVRNHGNNGGGVRCFRAEPAHARGMRRGGGRPDGQAARVSGKAQAQRPNADRDAARFGGGAAAGKKRRKPQLEPVHHYNDKTATKFLRI